MEQEGEEEDGILLFPLVYLPTGVRPPPAQPSVERTPARRLMALLLPYSKPHYTCPAAAAVGCIREICRWVT